MTRTAWTDYYTKIINSGIINGISTRENTSTSKPENSMPMNEGPTTKVEKFGIKDGKPIIGSVWMYADGSTKWKVVGIRDDNYISLVVLTNNNKPDSLHPWGFLGKYWTCCFLPDTLQPIAKIPEVLVAPKAPFEKSPVLYNKVLRTKGDHYKAVEAIGRDWEAKGNYIKAKQAFATARSMMVRDIELDTEEFALDNGNVVSHFDFSQLGTGDKASLELRGLKRFKHYTALNDTYRWYEIKSS